MTTLQKAALSLLISVLLIGAFLFLVITGLLNLPETNLYNLREPIQDGELITIVLLASLFFTVFLTIFFLFNLRQDQATLAEDGSLHTALIAAQIAEAVSENTSRPSLLMKAATLTGTGIIKEREGIHYINEDALTTESESSGTFNREFKDLVDSVIKS